MKRSVRHGVFETNSSSTHSLTICTAEVYDTWCESEELYMDGNGKLFTYEEVAEIAKAHSCFNNGHRSPYSKKDVDDFITSWFIDEYMTAKSYDHYVCDQYETFERTFETPSGDKMVAFGYHGHD